MPADNPRFVPELHAQEPTSYRRAVSVVKSRLGISKYKEVFGEKIYTHEGQEFPSPTKVVLKDGLVIAETLLYTHRFGPLKFLSPTDVPGFAVGRCVDLTDGDYKSVMIDQDGQSDTVIKRYWRHTYWGDGAQDRAEAAANKIDQMYAVMGSICPDYLLPTQRFTYQMPDLRDGKEGWGVFERQQRAIFASPWLCEDPKTAEEIVKAGHDLSYKYHKKIGKALIKEGICQRAPFGKGVDLSELGFCLSYDAVTRSLKENDIIDYVHLNNPSAPTS